MEAEEPKEAEEHRSEAIAGSPLACSRPHETNGEAAKRVLRPPSGVSNRRGCRLLFSVG